MYLDLLLLILMIFLVIRGAMSGFVAQIFALITWILMILLTPNLAHWFQHQNSWTWIGSAPVAVLWILSALCLFAIMKIVEWMVALARKNPKPSPAARWLGAGLGFIKAFIVAIVLGSLLHLIPESLRLRYPDLDRDFSQSRFLSMSRATLTWDSLRFFGSLQAVHNNLKESGLSGSRLNPSGPWIPDSNPDSD